MNPTSYTVPTPTRDELLRARRSTYRFLLIPGAVVAAIAHIPVAGPHLREAPSIIGYAATRTLAFPQLADDVGNWLEPLGVVCVLSEALTLMAGIAAVRRALSRPPQPQLHHPPAS